ncbi:MAG: hypothetical protein JXA99_03355, partial [Candidatus Lokiarchaeota archaeon]|nr:hypothetical protein [Candidatus Lokiarchaeota archaeon]
MKIALNCCYYGRTSGGIKEYIYNLVTNIIKILPPDQLIFYISPDDEEYWKETIPIDLSYKKIPFKRENKIRRAILEKYFWNYELIQEKFDLFHSPFFHVPLRLNCKKIMTVHDLRFRKFPESYPFKRRLYLQYKVLQSLK